MSHMSHLGCSGKPIFLPLQVSFKVVRKELYIINKEMSIILKKGTTFYPFPLFTIALIWLSV